MPNVMPNFDALSAVMIKHVRPNVVGPNVFGPNVLCQMTWRRTNGMARAATLPKLD